MWSDSARYLACDPSQFTNPANTIASFCVGQGQQGSGYYRSPVDNYNIDLVMNLPFIGCAGDALPAGNSAPDTSVLHQDVCGADSCQGESDAPQCSRIVRRDRDSYVNLISQNFGDGGRPHCEAAAGEIISRCVQDKGLAGGWWGIGGMQGNSQEYVELTWKNERLPYFEDFDEPTDE